LLDADRLNPLAHFHHGLVLEQMGRYPEAERSLRRAIYLDRQSPLLHFHLGLLLRSREDGRATRSFENALELLAERVDDDSIPGAEDLTVAQLRTLTQIQIELVDGRQ
jgi:chemotaxis protein methyltransferase CheR